MIHNGEASTTRPLV